MKHIIINADDFGLTKKVTDGIIESWKNGVVSSTTMMMNLGESTEYAIQKAKEYPELPIGVHLNIRLGKPLAEGIKNNVDENGNFIRWSLYETEHFDLDEIEKEFCAQIDYFYESGLVPTHLDSHHHAHIRGRIKEVTKKVAKKYNLPIRTIVDDNLDGIVQPTYMSDWFYDNDATVETIEKLVNKLNDNEVMDIMCHPGYSDEDLRMCSSYNAKRECELELLKSEDLKSLISDSNVSLTSYNYFKEREIC